MQQKRRKPDLIFILALLTGMGVAATEIAHGISDTSETTTPTTVQSKL